MAKEKQLKKSIKKKKNRSKALLATLETLFDFAPPQQLSRRLRHVLLCYISHEREVLPQEIDEIILQLSLLMEFLDEAGEANAKKS